MTMVYHSSYAGGIMTNIKNCINDIIAVTLCLLVVLPLPPYSSAQQQFDPYQLNGGLVAAVAGRDYVLIASDTRLTDGGYGIKSRNYLSGRIWSAHSSSALSKPFDYKDEKEEDEGSVERKIDAVFKPISTPRPRPIPTANYLWDANGSLIGPSSNDGVVKGISSSETTILSTTIAQYHSYHTTHVKSKRIQSNIFPIMIGSAGCASDCEALKRRMRLELDALLSCSSSSSSSSPNKNNNSRIEVQSVANLLQQILYGRRTFPFYSFCVVAGIDTRSVQRRGGKGGGGGERRGVGAVYAYDAIGSYERVAVACAGTGRELLQPVLDRLFSSPSSSLSQQKPRQPRRKLSVLNDELEIEKESKIVEDEEEEEEEEEEGDSLITTIPAEKQRMGTAGSLRPPVITHVNCPWEEAVRNVAHAYMSVAEREISVGDELVICVVDASSSSYSSSSSSHNEGPMINVFSYPLKRH